MILETNIVLYHARDQLSTPLCRGAFAVSFAATAIELTMELVTNDLALANLPGLTCRSIPLKSS
jgi:hypothetical protein